MSLIWNILTVFPDQADPRSKDWFLMSCPWPVIILTYLYVKLVTDWGPKWMKTREPFQVDRLVQIYDLFQIGVNAYILQQGITQVWMYYSWKCEPVDYSMNPVAIRAAELTHLYMVVKLTDFLDTIFFVVRKKQNQVTFLHVYHHASMLVLTWTGVRFIPGGHGTFVGLINSFIHVIMYSHYFVMSLKICEPWWKKYVTQMQLIQFVLIFFHFLQLFWVEDCGYPKALSIVFVPQNFLMIYMFSKFYYYAYIKPPKKTKAN